MPRNLELERRTHKERSIEKIKNGLILERLISHFGGEVELSPTQVNVGLSLLKKYLPDLKVVENTGAQKLEVIVSAKSAKTLTTAVRSAITRS